MGGVIRRVRKVFRKVTKPVRRVVREAARETLKATGALPSNKEIAGEQMKADAAAKAAQEKAAAEAKAAREKAAAEAEAKRKQDAAFKAQQGVDVVDANNPDDAEYSEGKTKKKRKKTKTILTGTKGVIGDAPTESKTLLGG